MSGRRTDSVRLEAVSSFRLPIATVGASGGGSPTNRAPLLVCVCELILDRLEVSALKGFLDESNYLVHAVIGIVIRVGCVQQRRHGVPSQGFVATSAQLQGLEQREIAWSIDAENCIEAVVRREAEPKLEVLRLFPKTRRTSMATR